MSEAGKALLWMTIAVLLALVVLMLFMHGTAPSRELNNQYANVSPEVQQWFRDQKTKDGKLCCSMADGTYAEEDIRGNQYWTRFVACDGGKCQVVDWMPVPNSVVINTRNPNGAPVVWWSADKSGYTIRCYVPGAGT